MSEYGLKIQNFAAGSVYQVLLGVRDNYDATTAMITNSLFLDFMLNKGIQVWNGESTRSIICIDFKYGSRSYNEDMRHIKKFVKDTPQRYEKLRDRIEKNKDKYDKKSKSELRTLFYKNGVDIIYNTYSRGGEILKSDRIHYKRLFRTAGKAKAGKCMFIDERLYDAARDFITMGVKLPDNNSPIVELEAYSALITSSIVGRIKIDPKNILVLEDFDSFVTTDVTAIKINKSHECIAEYIENYKLQNEMFDGQALIDESVFPPWADGYVLLRQHMTKAAAFCTKIQKFFRDHYCENYETAEIKDAFGNLHKAKDIEVITTVNATKFIKFGISYEKWCEKVNECGNYFGVVKTSHKSKLGNFQRQSYQMVNTLDVHMMTDAMQTTVDELEKLQSSTDAFLEYLRKESNFSNDYDVLIKLVEQNPLFARSKYFRDRKAAILKTYVKQIRGGRLLQNGDNLTIVGSPYAMLMWTVGLNPEDDPTFSVEDDAMQCYTSRFEDGEYLAEYRSPMNSRNNVGHLHNHYHEYFTKYFDFGEQIIAINMVHTCFQSRNNGSDQDSDSLYVTNQPSIVKHAKFCYLNYPTIENLIPKEKNHYQNTMTDLAVVDNKLGSSQLAIGSSSNLCQLALTFSYNYPDQKYIDYVCILSVLAQVAIDNAKRSYDIDINAEINRIRNDLDIDQHNYPAFWRDVEFKQSKNTGFAAQKSEETLSDMLNNTTSTTPQKKSSKIINPNLRCPMNVLHCFKPRKIRDQESTIPTEEFINTYKIEPKNRRTCKKVEELIEKYSLQLYQYNVANNDAEEYFMLQDDFNELISDIQRVHLSNNYLSLIFWLVNRAFKVTPQLRGKTDKLTSRLDKNRSLLLKTLYEVCPDQLMQVFCKNPVSAKEESLDSSNNGI